MYSKPASSVVEFDTTATLEALETPEPSRTDSSSDRALVIIPTYNEAENIRTVLSEVISLPEPINVLVIDDGSPDETARCVKEVLKLHPNRIRLIERGEKLGLGTAYIRGFRYALEHGFTYVCEMDADLSHNPVDLLALIETVRSGQADVAIGSRYIDGVRVMNWPLGRLMLSYGAGAYTRLITRLPVFDVTAGFICYHRRVLDDLDLDRVKSNGYSFQVEMKYRAWRRGFRLAEIPIVFTERTEGKSKMSRAIVREAAWRVWELRIRDLMGKL